MNQGYAPQGGFAQQNPYAQQQNPYAQQNPYQQAPNAAFGAAAGGYAAQQPNAYAQQPVQPAAQGWVCPACGARNGESRFCECCGTPRQ